MKHRIVTAAQMKEIERAGNAHGLPYLQMMENAGLAAYAQLRARLPQGGALLIVCGKGNNGGDGLVMARAAAKDGWRVVVLLAEGDPKTPDAMTNYARLADLPVTGSVQPSPSASPWQNAVLPAPRPPVNAISVPAGSVLASSRPTATVSSREWVTNSCISKLLVLGRIRRGHTRIYYSTEIRICKI